MLLFCVFVYLFESEGAFWLIFNFCVFVRFYVCTFVCTCVLVCVRFVIFNVMCYLLCIYCLHTHHSIIYKAFFLINEKKYCLFPSVNLYCPMNLSRNPIIKNLKIHYLLQKNVTLKINTKRIIFAVLNYTSCTQRKESFHLLI